MEDSIHIIKFIFLKAIMKSFKLNHLLVALFSTVVIVGCDNSSTSTDSGGSSPQLTQSDADKSANEAKAKKGILQSKGKQIQTVDLWEQAAKAGANGSNGISNCAGSGGGAGNDICFSLTQDDIAASFQSGLGAINYWVWPNVTFQLTVKFNTNVTNFRLADIIDKLPAGSLPNGHISQVITDACDSLVSSGSTSGKSCKINLAYVGTNTNSTETINFNFKWGSATSPSSYSFPITFKNRRYSTQNMPVINSVATMVDGIIPVFAPYGENADNSGLEYLTHIHSLSLRNMGAATLPGNGGIPSVSVKLGAKGSAYDFSDMYANNSMDTECEDDDVKSGAVCDFNFEISGHTDANGEITSQTGLFDFEYTDSTAGSGNSTLKYMNRFFVSQGDFLPLDQHILLNTESSSHTFYISKQIVGAADANAGVNYTTNLLADSSIPEGVKFSLIYKPQFYTGSTSFDGTVEYAVGDYTNSAKSMINPQELLNKGVNYSFDKNCLMSGFDPRYEDVATGHTCPIQISFNKNYADYLSKKPISAILVARYKSPVENRIVSQALGTIVIFSPHASMVPANILVAVGSASSGNDGYIETFTGKNYSDLNKYRKTLILPGLSFIGGVAYKPGEPGTLFAAGHENSVISNDNGENWKVLDSDPKKNTVEITSLIYFPLKNQFYGFTDVLNERNDVNMATRPVSIGTVFDDKGYVAMSNRSLLLSGSFPAISPDGQTIGTGSFGLDTNVRGKALFLGGLDRYSTLDKPAFSYSLSDPNKSVDKIAFDKSGRCFASVRSIKNNDFKRRPIPGPVEVWAAPYSSTGAVSCSKLAPLFTEASEYNSSITDADIYSTTLNTLADGKILLTVTRSNNYDSRGRDGYKYLIDPTTPQRAIKKGGLTYDPVRKVVELADGSIVSLQRQGLDGDAGSIFIWRNAADFVAGGNLHVTYLQPKPQAKFKDFVILKTMVPDPDLPD